MRYFSLYEILIGCFGFSVMGFILGLLQPLFPKIVCFPKSLIRFLRNISKASSIKNLKSDIKSKIKASEFKNSGISDFFFVSFYLVLITLFTYLYFDGIIRVFPIVFSLITFLFSFKKITPKLYRILFKVAYPINFFVTYTVSVMFIPINYTVSLLNNLILIIFNPIKRIIKKKLSYSIKQKKFKELGKMFNA